MEFDSTTSMRLSQSFSPNPSLKFINNQNLSSAFPNLPLTVCSSSSSSGSSSIERIKYHFVLPSNHEDWLGDFHVVDTQNFKDHFFDDSLHSLMRNGVFVKIREYQKGALQLSIKHILPSSDPKILVYEEFKQPFSTPPKESLFSIVKRKLKEWEVEESQLKIWKMENVLGIFPLPAICVSRVRYSLPSEEQSTQLFVNVDLCEFNGNDPHHRFFTHGSLELDDAVSFDREKLPREIANKFDDLTPTPSKILAFISTYNQDLYEKLNHEHAFDSPFIIADNSAPYFIDFPSSISIMKVSVVGELITKMPKSILDQFTKRIKEWEDLCGSEAIKKFEFLKPNSDENFEQMRYYIRFLISIARTEESFKEMLYSFAPEMLVPVPDFSEFEDYF